NHTLMYDYTLDEDEVVRQVHRADNYVDFWQVGDVADLHFHGELDAKRFHIQQVGLYRLLKSGVESELPGILAISGHQRVAKGRLHGTGRPGDEDDFRGQNVGADHFFKSIDCIAEGHGHAV